MIKNIFLFIKAISKVKRRKSTLLFQVENTFKRRILLNVLLVLVNVCQAEELIFLNRPCQETFSSREKVFTRTLTICDSLRSIPPNPIEKINYEGLLPVDSLRIKTQVHLEDMQRLSVFYKMYLLNKDSTLIPVLKKYILAWSTTYRPTGNPINENKLIPVIYAYGLTQSFFSKEEREKTDSWLREIVAKELSATNIPMNNWETKRIHLTGIIGLIVHDSVYINTALDKTTYYLENALYADGSSSDIKTRDALSYHVNALKPLLQLFIALSAGYDEQTASYYFRESSSKASIRQAVEYVIPYTTGEKTYYQWRNTTVAIDKKRAEANLEEYIPGVAYRKEKSYPLVELASFFDETLLQYLPYRKEDSWTLLVLSCSKKNKVLP